MTPIIYLSTFFPPRCLDILQYNMKSAANISASAFSYSLLMGLVANNRDNLSVINTPLTGPYPIDYKKYSSSGIITNEYGIDVQSIGMCNFYGIQGISISRRLVRAIKKVSDGKADIIVYSIQLPILRAAVIYKKQNPGSRIFLVVPDLFEDLGGNSHIKKAIKSLLFGDYNKLCQDVDAYVLLTPLMIERMSVRRPYCVVEGIYNPSEKRQAVEGKNGFTILYTGMLYEKFGVKNLIDAVHSLEEKDVKLKLCGSGELVDYINSINDTRIEYLGVVPREKVLQMQSEASLLINPRQPNGGFTRYSFPSKNIEYLASGTPTLIYELEGIPSEYFDYCYHLSEKERSVEDLRRMIEYIYMTPEKERTELAAKAKEFILVKKNAPAQAKKIIDFINGL